MENTQTKSRKKLWISLGSLAVCLIVGLSITVGVLAASQATVTNSITVTYTASEVAAVVSGKYQVLHESEHNFETSEHETTITFDGTEGTASGSFVAVNDITLTSANNSVTFTYVIQNTSTTKAITAQVTLPTTATNITVSAGTAVDNAATPNAVTVTPGTNHATDTFTVAASTTVTYTVTASITNVANNAEYSGSFVWALS